MSPPTSQQNPPLALVIDDDLSMRVSMRAAMVKVGFDVIEAEAGPIGIALFEKYRPDLILLDVLMPGMDGFEICSSIRMLPGGQYVQILMVTGLDDLNSIEKAFEAGANDFISKPINWVMLGHRGRYMLRAGRAFQEQNKSKTRLKQTQKLAKLGNWEVDLNTNELLCSPEAQTLLGVKIVNTSFNLDDFLTTVILEERNSVLVTIQTALAEKKAFNINYQVVHRDGTIRHILNQGEILLNSNNEPEIMLGAVQDVSQLKIAEEEIRILAFYDGLTGLANRMLFLDRLTQEIVTAKRYDQQLALLYLDLDQFKKVNDTFGHHFGDLLLKKVSEILKNCIRGSDTASRLQEEPTNTIIARLGGDEFTILLSDIKQPEYAALVARRILSEINTYLTLEGHEINITTSIGISLYPSDGNDADLLLKNADTAMYHAKKTGRNNFQFFIEELNIATIERFNLERDIIRAISRDEFSLYFQPKIDLRNLRLVGAEALIRWMHPERGIVSPDIFIPIAEESGQINAIDRWVFNTACKQWKIWEDEGYSPGVIAVNLSGRHFGQKSLLQSIKNSLESVNISPKNIEIEITENILMENTKETVDILDHLRKLGILIALDDFGTGYSSLSYLTAFQVNTIKIDRSFIMGCTKNRNNLIIIKAIIAMGHSLGMKIVAEGIETSEDLILIRKLGADEAQGYFFSRPLCVKDFTELLKDKNPI